MPRSKTSMGWFYGFKLHLIINKKSELLGIQLTPGNTDDRNPLSDLVVGLHGSLYVDKGYISIKTCGRRFASKILMGIEM